MKSWMLSAVLVIGMTSLASAELAGGSQTLSLMAGGGFSGSEFDDSVTNTSVKHEKVSDPGGAFGAQYVYYLRGAPAVGVGLDVLHSALKEHLATTVNTDYDFRTRFQPTAVLAIAKLAFGQGRIHPYLLGGIGFHHTSFYWDFQPKGGTTWGDTGGQENRRIIDGAGTGFASALGIGLDLFVTPTVFVGGEARGTYLGSATYAATADARAAGFTGPDPHGDLLVFNLLARVGVKFGR